jgi:uncharacterized protein
MKSLSRLLQLWMSWVLAWPRLVLVLAAAMAIASLALTATKLGMVTDQLELIASDHPLIALSDRLDPFRTGGKSCFFVVVEAPTPNQAVSFITNLSIQIKEDKTHFQDVIFRVDPDAFKAWQLLYLDKQDLVNIQEKIDDHLRLVQGISKAPDLLSFLTLINQEMASRMVGEFFTGFLEDTKSEKETSGKREPFDLSFLIVTLEGMSSYLDGSPAFKSPWSSFFKDASWDPDLEGYFWEANKRYLLAFVVPRETEAGFIETRESLARLRKLLKETQALFPDIQAGVTGQEALKIDEVETVSDDMTKATWLSLLGVFLLMVTFFRSFRRPLIEIVTLMVGLCWTFGWTTLFIGHLNILSVVFAPILCGLGVDYGIHWLSRLEEEERCRDRDFRSVLARVNERSGYGIFVAGWSAALSFLPLILTGFRGLVEMGLVTGMGIVFTLLATFSVLPALTLLFPRSSGTRGSPHPSPAAQDLIRLKPLHARMILSGAIILCLLGMWSGSQVSFDPNPLRMQAANAESVIWEKKLIEKAKRSPLFAAAFATTPAETIAKSEAMEKLPTVAEVETVFSLLPKDQFEKLPLLQALSRKIPAISTDRRQDQPGNARQFIDILERIRFKMQDDQADRWGAEKPLVAQMTRVRALAQKISESLAASPGAAKSLIDYGGRFAEDLRSKWDLLSQPTGASAMTIRDLPELVRSWYLQGGTYLLRIYPKESIFEEHALSRFVGEIRSIDAEVIGNPVSLYVFANAFKGACVSASIYALAAISLLLLRTFRSLSLALLALVPLSLGSLWTVGLMGWVGIQFNLANSIFMPLVVGAGVEYGVIVLYRWREGNMLPGHLPFSTGKGVILAALTTTLGFGALMVSRHRGIFSLGFVAWAGSLCVLLPAIVILPAILLTLTPVNETSGKATLKGAEDIVCGDK